MMNQPLLWLFHFDVLAVIMIALVAFIGLCVGSFAWRYLKGDTQYRVFFVQLGLLVVAVAAMVSADHLVVLFATWCASNALLVRLMVHKHCWRAAKASGALATRNYVLGAACMALAFALLYAATGQTSIQALVQTTSPSGLMLPALVLLLVAAMTQSAIWPFHRWLTSSLNSPTPVSAIMHAGLVNGGGFLLARFAPLYFVQSTLLTAIFAIGIASALLGTLWKLMQSDVKRMLACSTMGQMGFMLAQCGLGLFPAAVAHLVWHGTFKAYLFLASGGAAQEQRLDMGYPPKTFAFICALLCGAVGSMGFAYALHESWFAADTTLVLVMVAFLAASQFALTLLRENTLRSVPFALAATALMSLAYGGSVRLITSAMEPMGLMQPQPLNGFHLLGIAALALAWLSALFLRGATKPGQHPVWMLKGYVAALNASQPHASTITAHRNHYQYQ
ncbi:MAG: proton-conducting transporter membrane subunit [Rickettsiales bacterium]